MNNQRLEYLFQNYLDKTCSSEERMELMEMIESGENETEIKGLLLKAITGSGDDLAMSEESANQIMQIILNSKKEFQGAKIMELQSADIKKARLISFGNRVWSRYIAAAVIIVAIGIGSYIILNKQKSVAIAKTPAPAQNDVAPGKEGAILTLANGTQIMLDSTQNGVITQQGNSNVVKKENALSYQTNSNVQNVVYNTMSTPNGRQYSLVLADGSKVSLNAGSSIRFPSAFTGKERKVEITGEVYFEVVKNPSMPFRVAVNDMTVEVLGTHFDINSYSDEGAIKTTLLEGAVTVTKGDKIVKLTPGQQSVLENNGALSVNKDVNTDEIMAWKGGYFHFESADLKTILRQFARWYDVDVVYEGSVSDRKFFGIVKRNNTLKRVLEMLQDNNIAYRIEGRKLIVKGE